MDSEEAFEVGLEGSDELLVDRKWPDRESHVRSADDWVQDYSGATPTLRYQGPQHGWYLAERWSETRTFGPEKVAGVYVIQRRPSGAVKIGYSIDIYQRRDSLQTSSDETLFIVTILDLPMEWEKVIHKRLSQYRIRGEWFSPECLDEIDDRYPRV